MFIVVIDIIQMNEMSVSTLGKNLERGVVGLLRYKVEVKN